ncbi:MAG: DUF805 domain-containing protein [Acetobacteraceae bacterium]|nr:DUF805 domain-containing protein [Acetobacteraceae bacterium]
MGFQDAVTTALSRYARFHGRARRAEYWWFMLFVVLSHLIGSALDMAVSALAPFPVFGTLISLALLIPSLSAAVRRLHDANRSGWWLLLPAGLAPLVLLLGVYVSELGEPTTGGLLLGIGLMLWLPVAIMLILRGTDGGNRFGADPLAVG